MRGARTEQALESAIGRDGVVRRGERLLVACSGGPDSVALAALLHVLARPMGLELSLAYVNHGVRRSAWQDECVVLRIAAGLGLRCEILALDGAAADENAMREARYAALAAAARRHGAGAVAAAHHAQDQSETVLLALLRGAGSNGLAGMRPRRPLADGVDLVRPLLRQPPERLREYCHLRALPYAVDPTNARLSLRRNAVRAALEALRPLFPALDEAVARAAVLVGDEREGSPRAGMRRTIRERLAREAQLRDVDFEHVEAAVRTIERGGSGSFHMRAGVRLDVEAGTIAAVEREP
ncbi:MAG TPA: tRNA lysidine(34) synthetase TilS [Verrucomicrobiae bacterium]|nr:tRNA lysidine(34) synthetase TilS [Verrucomicrobiae bacterium]